MRSHTQSVVIELNRRRITGSISYKPLINDLSVLRVCNKTGGTIKGDIKKVKVPQVRTSFLDTVLKKLRDFSVLVTAAKTSVVIYVLKNEVRLKCINFFLLVRHGEKKHAPL